MSEERRLGRTWAFAARRSRLLDWLLLAAAGACALVAVVVDLRQGPGEKTPHFLAAAFGLLGGGALAHATWSRWHREGPRRVGVLLLGIGGMVALFGQSLGYVFSVAEAGPFDGRIETIPLTIASPLIAFGLYLVAWPRGLGASDLWSILLDSAVGIAGVVILWLSFVAPRWTTPRSTSELVWFAVDRSILLLGLCLIILLSAASRRVGALSLSQVSLLLGSGTLFLVGDTLGEVLDRGDRVSGVTHSLVAYTLALGLMVAFLHRPPIEVEKRSHAAARDAMAVAIPLIVAFLAGLLVIVEAVGFDTAARVSAAIGWSVLLGAVLIARLMSARELRETREESFEQLLQGRAKAGIIDTLLRGSSELILVLDSRAKVRYMSPAAAARLPLLSQVSEPSLAMVTQDWTEADLASILAEVAVDSSATGPYDMSLRQPDGTVAEMETTITLTRDEDFECFVLVAKDVTAARKLVIDLEHARTRDSLTGLMSGGGMAAEIAAVLDGPGTRAELAFVALDISDFGVWNDTLGREVGDEVLKAVGNAFQTLPPEVHAVARLSGDSFGWLIVSPQASRLVTECVRLATDLLGGLILPDDREISLRFRTGYSIRAAGARSSPDRLMEEADIALRRARLSSGARTVMFRPGMNEDLIKRLSADVELRDALGAGRLEVWYQPVIDLKQNTAIGLEALARVRARDGSLVPPDAFIPVAEQIGLIGELGRVMRRQAFRDAVSLGEILGRSLQIAVNVSPKEIDDALVTSIQAELAQTHLAADRLVVEVTETAIHERVEESARVLSDLRKNGVEVAIDDFGTGYSSMSALVRLPADVLKIDKSFVQQMTTSRRALTLVRSVVRLGESLGMDLVAEGVETEDVADALKVLDCTRAQGYLYARPMPYDELVEWFGERGDVPQQTYVPPEWSDSAGGPDPGARPGSGPSSERAAED